MYMDLDIGRLAYYFVWSCARGIYLMRLDGEINRSQ